MCTEQSGPFAASRRGPVTLDRLEGVRVASRASPERLDRRAWLRIRSSRQPRPGKVWVPPLGVPRGASRSRGYGRGGVPITRTTQNMHYRCGDVPFTQRRRRWRLWAHRLRRESASHVGLHAQMLDRFV
jgi:hypothetical protein